MKRAASTTFGPPDVSDREAALLLMRAGYQSKKQHPARPRRQRQSAARGSTGRPERGRAKRRSGRTAPAVTIAPLSSR